MMKRNQIFLMAVILLTTFSACNKDEVTGDKEISLNPKDAPVLVAKISSISESDFYNSESTSSNFYDDGNKLIKTIRTFKVIRDGNLTQDDKDTVNYYYDNEDRVIELVQTGDNWPHSEEFTYSNNKITQIEMSHSESGLGRKTESFTNSDGEIIKRQDYSYDSYSETWIMIQSYDIYQWQNNNLIKTIGYKQSSKKSSNIIKMDNQLPFYNRFSDSILDVETTYVYNDKISPFAFSSVKAAEYITAGSKNLITSSELMSVDGRFSMTDVYNYEYGANGFPEKVIRVNEVIESYNGDSYVYKTTNTSIYEYIDLK